MVNPPAHTSSIPDIRALDLIEASGVLNPDLTLDKLMDVTRQLADLQPATEDDKQMVNIFIHRFYCLKHQPFPIDGGTQA